MLPFLKNKDKQNGMISQRFIRPDGEISDKRDSSNSEGIEAAAKDILNAIQSGDHKRLAEALHAAFQIYDSLPHVEGEHVSESSEKI